MTFRDELENILREQLPGDLNAYFEPYDQALTSIINLVDKDIIGEDIESDHQMSHRQGKTEQRNKLNKKAGKEDE